MTIGLHEKGYMTIRIGVRNGKIRDEVRIDMT